MLKRWLRRWLGIEGLEESELSWQKRLVELEDLYLGRRVTTITELDKRVDALERQFSAIERSDVWKHGATKGQVEHVLRRLQRLILTLDGGRLTMELPYDLSSITDETLPEIINDEVPF